MRTAIASLRNRRSVSYFPNYLIISPGAAPKRRDASFRNRFARAGEGCIMLAEAFVWASGLDRYGRMARRVKISTSAHPSLGCEHGADIGDESGEDLPVPTYRAREIWRIYKCFDRIRISAATN